MIIAGAILVFKSNVNSSIKPWVTAFLPIGILLLLIGDMGFGGLLTEKQGNTYRMPEERHLTPKENRFWRQIDTVTYTYDPRDKIRKR